jgi:hypothetical protein
MVGGLRSQGMQTKPLEMFHAKVQLSNALKESRRSFQGW